MSFGSTTSTVSTASGNNEVHHKHFVDNMLSKAGPSGVSPSRASSSDGALTKRQEQQLLEWLNNLSVQDKPQDANRHQLSHLQDSNEWARVRGCAEKIGLIMSLLKVPALGNTLSPSLKRKLASLSRCNFSDNKERAKTMRTAISVGNRILNEFLAKHTDSHQAITTLWNAVRTRGCQFLGPAIQEEILKLALLTMEDGETLTRKVLVMFIMQRLMPHFPYQTSKTSIGHVVQILYRASCFNVIKRDGDSSLMQLKEEFRTYEALRREHDSQLVSIALESGVRISPEQWSSLLYGDNLHRSHMQSVIDKLQSVKPSFNMLIQKLKQHLLKSKDPTQIIYSIPYFEQLAYFDSIFKLDEEQAHTLEHLSVAIEAVSYLTIELLTFFRFLQQNPQRTELQ